MTITTEEAEELAKGAFMLMDDPPDLDDQIMLGSDFLADMATALRSLAAERDALQAEKARLREAIEMAIDCIEDRDVIGAKQTLTFALGEKE